EMDMPNSRVRLLAGAAAAVIGFSGAALAQSPNIHTMTVQLPGGGVAEIQYTGNVPPQVTVSSGPAAIGALLPTASLFAAQSPFATLDRMAAAMDREAAALFRYADATAMQPWPGSSGRMLTSVQNLPPGTRGFSYVSTV